MAIKKNKTTIGVIFAVVCLLVIVLGGSMFYLVRGGASQSTITSKKITPTVPLPTQTVTATAQTQPLFFDDFVNSNKGWSLSNVSGYTRKIEHSNLTLADQNHKTLTESLPTTTTFNNFMVTVTFTLVQASGDDSVGLYLRGDSYLDHDYRVDLYGNNTYAISKEFLDSNGSPQTTFLVKPTVSAVLHPVGEQNTIMVMMKGPHMVLLMNSVEVTAVDDSAYTAGQIALFVQNSAASEGVAASFSSIAVYPVLDTLPPG